MSDKVNVIRIMLVMAIIFFFLPISSLSFDGDEQESVTGIELAVGNSDRDIESNPNFVIVFASTCLGFALCFGNLKTAFWVVRIIATINILLMNSFRTSIEELDLDWYELELKLGFYLIGLIFVFIIYYSFDKDEKKEVVKPKCAACGAELLKGADFCTSCGCKLTVPQES